MSKTKSKPKTAPQQETGGDCNPRLVLLEADHCWQTCKEPECEECQRLVDYGILMACDECGLVGYKEVSAAGNVQTDWNLCEDGSVLCGYCYEQNRTTSYGTAQQTPIAGSGLSPLP